MNFPNLRRIRHSSILTSNISPSSDRTCQMMLCCTRTRIQARTVRGLRAVKRINWVSGRRPRTRSTETIFCSDFENESKIDKKRATTHCRKRTKMRVNYLNAQACRMWIGHSLRLPKRAATKRLADVEVVEEKKRINIIIMAKIILLEIHDTNDRKTKLSFQLRGEYLVSTEFLSHCLFEFPFNLLTISSWSKCVTTGQPYNSA